MINFKRLNPFTAMAPSGELIGIDLSSETLRVVYIRTSLKKSEVTGLICKDIANLSDDDIARVIGGALNELNPKNPLIADIIPSHIAITKNIEIPSCDQQEIKEIIGLQAGRHTPYSREEIIVDYVPIGTYKNSYTKILLMIVSRGLIKRHYDIFAKAGLRPEKLSFAPEGLAISGSKVLKSGVDDLPVSMVHIQERVTDFAVVLKNRPIFLRSIPIGARHLSEQRELYILKFSEELKKSFEAYQGEDIEKTPRAIIVTGAVDNIKDLEYQLHDCLRLPARIIPYFRQLPLSAGLLQAPSGSEYVSFLDMIGCLISYNDLKIDLTPDEIKMRKAIEERGKDLIKTGIFVLSIIVIAIFIFISKIYFKSAYIKNLDNVHRPLRAKTRKLEEDYEKVSRIKNYMRTRGYSLELLMELYKLIPEELELSEIRLDEQGRFSLSGTGDSMAGVFSFADKMDKSSYFKSVEIKHTTKRRDGARNVTDFEITAQLDKEHK